MKGKLAAKGTIQPPRIATAEDISRAIEAVPEHDCVRLRDYAQNRILRIGRRAARGRSGDDLYQEAVFRLLDGTRRWDPDKVDFATCLMGAIKSIASAWAAHRERNVSSPEYATLESELTENDEEGKPVSPFDILQAVSLNAEERAIESDNQAERRALANEIEASFANDDSASIVLVGFQSGMDGPAIQKDLGLTEKEYRTTVRRIRRGAHKIAERHYGR